MVQQLRFIEVSEVEELFVNQLRLGGRGNWLMVHAKWPSHLRGRERRFTGRRQRPCVSSPPKSGLISAGVQNITYAHVADPRSPSRDGHLFAWKHGAAGRCHFGLASGLGISDRKDMTFGPRKDQIEQGMRSPPLKGRNGARRPVPAALAERPLRDQTWDLRRDERQWARCAESSHSQDRGSMRKDRVLVSFR